VVAEGEGADSSVYSSNCDLRNNRRYNNRTNATLCDIVGAEYRGYNGRQRSCDGLVADFGLSLGFIWRLRFCGNGAYVDATNSNFWASNLK